MQSSSSSATYKNKAFFALFLLDLNPLKTSPHSPIEYRFYGKISPNKKNAPGRVQVHHKPPFPLGLKKFEY